MYDVQNHIPFTVLPTNDGKVSLTLEIESIHVKTFLTMLDSLTGFFRIINQKAKTAIAYKNVDDNLSAGARYYEEYSSAVIDTFKQLNRETNQTARELIPVTLQYIKQTYPNASYDSIKQILTKSGELKKNGFYKKNV